MPLLKSVGEIAEAAEVPLDGLPREPERQVEEEALHGREHVAEPCHYDVVNRGEGFDLLDVPREVLEHDDRAGAGVEEHPVELPRRVLGIDVDKDQPCLDGAEHGDGELEDVGHDYGEALALLNLKIVLEIGAEIVRELVKPPEGELCPVILEGGLLRPFPD